MSVLRHGEFQGKELQATLQAPRPVIMAMQQRAWRGLALRRLAVVGAGLCRTAQAAPCVSDEPFLPVLLRDNHRLSET